MYRLIVESLLGVERLGQRLVLSPQLPSDWDGFRLHYRYRGSVYAIAVRVADDGPALVVDGRAQPGNVVDLVDDGRQHTVEVRVARRPGTAVRAEQEDNQSKTIT